MTTDTVLSSDDQLDYWRLSNGNPPAFARAIEQAVLQSPEVKRLRQDSITLSDVISTIEELDKNGALPYSLERFCHD